MAQKGSSLSNLHRMIREATKVTPVAESFLADLQRSVVMDQEKSTRKSSKAYKPSSMTCIRNMYYQLIGAEAEKDGYTPSSIRISESGTASHEYLQKHILGMKANGIDCEYINVTEYIQQKELTHLQVLDNKGMETLVFDTRYNMRFKCDGIIRYKGRYYILEIKTEVTNKFLARQAVEPSHEYQASAYSISFDINEVLFLYEGREFCDWKPFILVVTPEMKEEYILKRIEICDSHVASNTVPPRPAQFGKSLCRYCKYIKRCKLDGE